MAGRGFETPVNAANLTRALEGMGQKRSDVRGAYPVIYHLDVTGRCNLSCLYCQRDFFLKTKHPFLKGDMPEEAFQALLPYFKHAKVVALLSMLGEPLVVKALPRWWTSILEAGAKPQTTTNGTFLTPELADLFTSAGGRLKISIDTFDQPVLDVLRPSMKADLLRDRLDLLEKCRKQKPDSRLQLGVNLCLTSLNLRSAIATMEECLTRTRVDVFTFANFRLPRDEQGQYHEAARKLSLEMGSDEVKEHWRQLLRWAVRRRKEDGIAFVFPYSRAEWARMVGDDARLLDEQSMEDRSEVDVDSASYYCCVPWLKVHVMGDGSVIPCHLLQWAEPNLIFGNVTKTPFEEIWNGPAFIEFRQNMAEGKRLNYCNGCTSWWRFYTPQRVD